MIGSAGGSCRFRSPGSEQDSEAEGWVRRTIADRHRLDQLVELYHALGFETRLVAATPDRFGEGCRACAIANGCHLLLTRKAAPPIGA